MIINLEQKQGKLLASYINKSGDVAFSQFNIPATQQYSWVYSRQKARATQGVQSFDFKPVQKIPAQFLSRNRLQEFFIDAGEEQTKQLFEQNFPKLYSCDIEVDVTDEGFAEASSAHNRINSIAFTHYPECLVFGVKPLTGEECDRIEKDINKHVKKFNRVYKFSYKYYENEADMIYDFLYNYARHVPLITGWFFWGYDWQYISNRCRRLNIDISWMSPTKQWYAHKIQDKSQSIKLMMPQHKLIVDYLAIYKKWDRTVDVKENDTLDFVAETVLGIQKVKYPGTLKELFNKDFEQYIFYNAIDTVLVELIDEKLKTMNTFLGLSNITRVEAMQAFSPIAMLECTLSRYAYKKRLVFPKSENHKEREEYEGAFVFEPTPGIYPWVASFDAASLYPTIMRQFKISIENFKFKDKNYIPNKDEIKTSSGAVFDASFEPLIPEILTDYYNQRKEAKKISLLAEKEADELKKILKERMSKSKSVLS
jgi:DNA polymerase elongation subunit (family B)